MVCELRGLLDRMPSQLMRLRECCTGPRQDDGNRPGQRHWVFRHSIGETLIRHPVEQVPELSQLSVLRGISFGKFMPFGDDKILIRSSSLAF